MAGMGQTLTEDAGPLPVWAWAGIGTVGIAGYLIYRKKKSMNAQAAAATNQADSSNLGTTPVSNLSVAAEPMPIQLGDTFINNQPPANNTTVNNPVTVNNPPAGNLPPAPKPNPPAPPVIPGTQPNQQVNLGGINYTRISNPSVVGGLLQKGYNVITYGNSEYYNPAQQLTGSPGMGLTYISNPTISKTESKKGKKIIQLGKSQFVLGTL